MSQPRLPNLHVPTYITEIQIEADKDKIITEREAAINSITIENIASKLYDVIDKHDAHLADVFDYLSACLLPQKNIQPSTYTSDLSKDTHSEDDLVFITALNKLRVYLGFEELMNTEPNRKIAEETLTKLIENSVSGQDALSVSLENIISNKPNDIKLDEDQKHSLEIALNNASQSDLLDQNIVLYNHLIALSQADKSKILSNNKSKILLAEKTIALFKRETGISDNELSEILSIEVESEEMTEQQERLLDITRENFPQILQALPNKHHSIQYLQRILDHSDYKQINRSDVLLNLSTLITRRQLAIKVIENKISQRESKQMIIGDLLEAVIHEKEIHNTLLKNYLLDFGSIMYRSNINHFSNMAQKLVFELTYGLNEFYRGYVLDKPSTKYVVALDNIEPDFQKQISTDQKTLSSTQEQQKKELTPSKIANKITENKSHKDRKRLALTIKTSEEDNRIFRATKHTPQTGGHSLQSLIRERVHARKQRQLINNNKPIITEEVITLATTTPYNKLSEPEKKDEKQAIIIQKHLNSHIPLSLELEASLKCTQDETEQLMNEAKETCRRAQVIAANFCRPNSLETTINNFISEINNKYITLQNNLLTCRKQLSEKLATKIPIPILTKPLEEKRDQLNLDEIINAQFVIISFFNSYNDKNKIVEINSLARKYFILVCSINLNDSKALNTLNTILNNLIVEANSIYAQCNRPLIKRENILIKDPHSPVNVEPLLSVIKDQLINYINKIFSDSNAVIAIYNKVTTINPEKEITETLRKFTALLTKLAHKNEINAVANYLDKNVSLKRTDIISIENKLRLIASSLLPKHTQQELKLIEDSNQLMTDIDVIYMNIFIYLNETKDQTVLKQKLEKIKRDVCHKVSSFISNHPHLPKFENILKAPVHGTQKIRDLKQHIIDLTQYYWEIYYKAYQNTNNKSLIEHAEYYFLIASQINENAPNAEETFAAFMDEYKDTCGFNIQSIDFQLNGMIDVNYTPTEQKRQDIIELLDASLTTLTQEKPDDQTPVTQLKSTIEENLRYLLSLNLRDNKQSSTLNRIYDFIYRHPSSWIDKPFAAIPDEKPSNSKFFSANKPTTKYLIKSWLSTTESCTKLLNKR